MATFKEWFGSKPEFTSINHEAEYKRDMNKLHKLKNTPNANRIDDGMRDRTIRNLEQKWKSQGHKAKPHKLGEPRTMFGKAKKALQRLRGKK